MPLCYRQAVGLFCVKNLGYVSARRVHGTGNTVIMASHLMRDECFEIHNKSNPDDTGPITFNKEIGIWSVHAEQYISNYSDMHWRFKSHFKGSETMKLISVNNSADTSPINLEDVFGVQQGKAYLSWDGTGRPSIKTHLEAYERWCFKLPG